MKKLFSAFTAVLLAFCFISCAPQELSDRSSKNEGSVSLSIRSPRTISPAEGISYKNVPEWTVTFKDRTAQYDDIEKTVSFIGNEPQEIRLPLGTYNVTLNGTANNPTSGETAQTVQFYGEASVTVKKDEIVPISVFVAPKKSGTGSFNFTVTTSGEFGNYTPVVSGNYFTVSLTPYGGEKPTATWTPTPTEISGSATESVIETGSSYSFSVSSETLDSKSVPSGFYTLSIKYTWVVGEDLDGNPLTKTKEIYYPNHDFFVEIIDKLETTGSVNITVSLEESKNYYVTKDANKANGNGAFESMPGYLDDVLDAVNRTTISTANIYIVDEVPTDGTSKSYPEIDVSKVNAKGKTYCIYTKSEKTQKYNSTSCYTITGAAIEGGEPTIDIERSVTTITLKNSQSSSGISGRAKIVALGSPEFVLKDNTSVFIDLTDQNNQIACTTICMPPDSTTFDSYYVENPCVTVKNFSTTQTSFSVFVEQSLSNSYSVVTNSSDDVTYKTTNFYIIPSYKAELPVTGIPNYDLVVKKDGLSVTDTQFYAGDTVTITATSKSEGGSFAEGTTFAWFINDKKTDCTAQSYTIKFGEGDAVAENTIICLVGYGTEYSTAQITLTAVENTVVLYNNTLDTAKSALSYAILKESSILYPSELIASNGRTRIKDFCFDASNNMYAIVSDGATSINKYTYNNGYNTNDVTTYTIDENAGVHTIDYIEASNDDKLYAVMTNTNYMTYIAQLTLTEPTPEANGTVSFTTYNVPIDWPQLPNIKTFCTDGTNFYVIVSITSYDNSQSEIQTVKLVSCTVSGENQLVENKSILLASTATVEGAKPVFSVSEYNDALEYKDLCYINDKLYLLVRDVQISSSSQEYYLISRGELRIFDVSGTGITARESGIGYQTASSTISYQQNGSTMTRTTFFGDSNSKLFYGPVKFIARKEDELLIADDGYCVDSSANVNTKNNIVKVNLKTESITGSYNLDSGYFDYYYSGQFGSSIYINGSQIY